MFTGISLSFWVTVIGCLLADQEGVLQVECWNIHTHIYVYVYVHIHTHTHIKINKGIRQLCIG